MFSALEWSRSGTVGDPVVPHLYAMNRHEQKLRKRLLSELGFSLMEILVVVGLMSIIVFGLYSMFNQTQRALLNNTTQVDVLEGGRAALDVLTREIEQAVAAGFWDTNLMRTAHMFGRMDYGKPLIQPLADQLTVRSNVLQSLYFLSRPDNKWVANGYFLATSTTNAPISINMIPTLETNEVDRVGVGTLYRFCVTNQPPFQLAINNLIDLKTGFVAAKVKAYLNSQSSLTNNPSTAGNNPVFPVLDGVVHFRLRPYDASGSLLFGVARDATWVVSPEANYAPTERLFYFASNSLPTYLELELGIVEPQVLGRLRSLPAAAQRQFLQRQVGAVHLFRKLILLRNAHP